MTEHDNLPLVPDPPEPELLEPELLDLGADPMADLLGNMGGLDLGSIMGAAQQMGAQMAEAQAQLAVTEVIGSSGSGLVKITSMGDGRFVAVTIAPGAIDPDDSSLLEDLILAALHDVAGQVTALQNECAPMGGIDLGGLFGG